MNTKTKPCSQIFFTCLASNRSQSQEQFTALSEKDRNAVLLSPKEEHMQECTVVSKAFSPWMLEVSFATVMT